MARRLRSQTLVDRCSVDDKITDRLNPRAPRPQRLRIASTHPSAARSMNDDIERSRSRPCATRVLAIRAPLAHRHARRTAVVKQASVLKSSTAKLLLSRRSAVRVAAIRAAKLGCHHACARQSIHVRSMHSTCRCIKQFIMNKKTLAHFPSLKLRRTPSRQACLKLAYGLGL